MLTRKTALRMKSVALALQVRCRTLTGLSSIVRPACAVLVTGVLVPTSGFVALTADCVWAGVGAGVGEVAAGCAGVVVVGAAELVLVEVDVFVVVVLVGAGAGDGAGAALGEA